MSLYYIFLSLWRKFKYVKCGLELMRDTGAGVWCYKQIWRGNVLGLYLNLELWDLLLKFGHSSNVVSFPQPHCHYLFFALQKNKRDAKDTAQDIISTTVLPKSEKMLIVKCNCTKCVYFLFVDVWTLQREIPERWGVTEILQHQNWDYQNKSLPLFGSGYWPQKEAMDHRKLILFKAQSVDLTMFFLHRKNYSTV